MVVRKLKDLVGALEVSGLYIAVDPARHRRSTIGSQYGSMTVHHADFTGHLSARIDDSWKPRREEYPSATTKAI
jgi:hypothetical protein